MSDKAEDDDNRAYTFAEFIEKFSPDYYVRHPEKHPDYVVGWGDDE